MQAGVSITCHRCELGGLRACEPVDGGRHNVLLLEAGPRDTDPWIHVPLGYGKLFAKKSVNWSYESEPEPTLGGRCIFTPRGKVLGGSSSINGLVYIRGQREDFDGWGVPGWRFDDLLPYFIKSEDQSRGASAWHGVGGPSAVSDLPDRHELCDAFIASAQALGIPRNGDFNGATQEGTGYYQATARNGRRCSTATGYLRPAENGPICMLKSISSRRASCSVPERPGWSTVRAARRTSQPDARSFSRAEQFAAAAATLRRGAVAASREPRHRWF